MENEENRGLIHKKASEDQLGSFCQLNFGVLSLFSLSLILLATYSFLRALLEGMAYLDSWSKKAKEEQDSARGHCHQQIHQIFLQVSSFMYGFFPSFCMHGICMWFLGCDMSLACRISWIDSGLPSLAISWIAMAIVGLLSLLCFGGSHVSLAWVDLLVQEALVEQMIWKPCNGLG